jgi:hypothetical protein
LENAHFRVRFLLSLLPYNKTALTLLIAESDLEKKELMIALVTHMLR